MEDAHFVVFRDKDPRLDWIGSADSIQAVRELVKSKAVGAREKFIIYSRVTHTTIYLRADDLFSLDDDL